jgi:hypothetical protein
MSYKNDNNGKDEINVGVGCLPYFLFFLILVGIRFFLAKGKTWESEFVEFLGFIYWVGIGYMVITILINKANEPRKLSKEKILSLSIENHKKNIEKHIDSNGKFKENYTVDNSEFLSHQLVELFNDQRELSYYKSRGFSFKSYSYSKNSDHEYRRKMIAKIIKDKGLIGHVFWGGLYEGQAYCVYYGIGECHSPGCHNQVTENWHTLCYSCFREQYYFREIKK